MSVRSLARGHMIRVFPNSCNIMFVAIVWWGEQIKLSGEFDQSHYNLPVCDLGAMVPSKYIQVASV